jgi:hypothetical protein
VPTNKEYRMAINVAFRELAAEQGDLHSYLMRAYVEYYFIDRPGLSYDDQLLTFQVAHQTLKFAELKYPFSKVVHIAHALVHEAMDRVAADAQKNQVDLDVKDPLVKSRQADFEAWTQELNDFIASGGGEDG